MSRELTGRARPRESDPDVMRSAFLSVARDFMRYCEAPLDNHEELAGVERDVLRAAQYQSDAFDIAKNLDDDGWEGSSELVDICEGFLSAVYHAHGLAVKEWAKTITETPRFAVGAQCAYRGEPAEITAVDAERATFTVFVPSRGHVRSGIGSRGYVVDWESKDLAIAERGATAKEGDHGNG